MMIKIVRSLVVCLLFTLLCPSVAFGDHVGMMKQHDAAMENEEVNCCAPHEVAAEISSFFRIRENFDLIDRPAVAGRFFVNDQIDIVQRLHIKIPRGGTMRDGPQLMGIVVKLE